MSVFQAIIYGVVQGLTEFLPVSSSAHLVLLPWFSGWEDPGLAFDVALHWGTLLGVVIYFRKDLKDLILGWLESFKGGRESNNILPWQIIAATVPAALAGLLLEDMAATLFRSPWVVAGTLAGFALLLYWADQKRAGSVFLEQMTWTAALVIGLAQALAIAPGVSRSGVTMTAALFLSLNRQAAVRFSFLLSIPIIFGAGLLELPHLAGQTAQAALWAGILSAALAGYAAVAFLMRFIKTRTFTPFVLYRLILAGAIVFWLIKA